VSKEQIETQAFQDAYLNVLALYTALKGSTCGVPKWSITGKVRPEKIDFLADVEIKAKRALTDHPGYYQMLMNLVDRDIYQQFPVDLQSKLGQVFKRNDLDVDGDYRILYYRAKNNQLQDREVPMNFPEEELNTEDLLND
jgi:hypothetical protein